ncbi:MAG: Crp/Fnr family transcriptional regulator [Gammaproteobacteria bacterium]
MNRHGNGTDTFPQNPSGADAQPAWVNAFSALRHLDDPAWRKTLAAAKLVTLPPGVTVFRHGDRCQNYLLVLEGSVRVQKVSDSGREIVLYRVEAGEGCVLTTSCLLAGERYPAEGITETEVRAVALPSEHFQEGLAGSAGFRNFVFATYGKRIIDLIVLVEDVAFGRIDIRLAQCLLNHADRTHPIESTHHDIATELGTAREVVSRQLKEFERRGWVRLGRGRIEILDPPALRALGAKGSM